MNITWSLKLPFSLGRSYLCSQLDWCQSCCSCSLLCGFFCCSLLSFFFFCSAEEAANIWALLHPEGGAPQRLALILLPFICPLHRQTHHMVVPLNGAECVAVVRAESHLMFCTISKQPLAGAPACKKEKHVHAKVTKKSWNSFPANANARFEALLSLF